MALPKLDCMCQSKVFPIRMLCRYWRHILNLDSGKTEFTQHEIVWLNVAIAAYIAFQWSIGYSEQPPFFNALVKHAHPAIWICIFMALPLLQWGVRVHKPEHLWFFFVLAASLWLVMSSMLWSSFKWAAGSVSVVHFMAPILCCSCTCVAIGMSAEHNNSRKGETNISASEGRKIIRQIERAATQRRPLAEVSGAR